MNRKAILTAVLAAALAATMNVTALATEQTDYSREIEAMSQWLDGLTLTPHPDTPKSITKIGWKGVEQSFKASVKSKVKDKDDEEKEDNAALPPLTEGDRFDGVTATVTEHTTTPPKPYTEDTLLAAMETAGNEDLDKELVTEKKGLGTPATRAATIEKLVTCGFITRKGQQLLPTPNGINLITVLPERIKSPALTAEWENALTRIATGQLSPESFMCDITALTSELVAQNRTASEKYISLFRQEKESVGTCPRCGGSVVEGKKNFYCSNRDCGFVMWKDDKFFTAKRKTLTKTIATELLKSGKILVKGLYSGKTGKSYDAVVVLVDTGDKYVNYRLDFGN